ncbi:hypothetical protein [Chryseobacterium balustinum]|uniref:Uncharacterized protein n=1 Tax=Chryseobacterium balustinum TaxID=246 RepID=A0ABY1LBB3_9FLAO|nr:hypothetical protein [Chryseobacterium balustinum]AZB32157.1 hypothetical protein EB354_23025 [Chryseobacterium balustinum]SKB93633.1 hypothetical protein SAMN05421800_11524 [Chryseobacterium balustinum]
MKILKTNWINILGVFICVLLYSIIYNFFIDDSITRTFLQSIFGAVFFLLLYGVLFWIGFILALIIFDLIIIIPNQSNLKLKLLLEWAIICLPFIYWAIIYERQRNIFIVAVVAFLITQLLRERLINKATH